MGIQDEIAIVGVGCRFPGADNLDEFWRVLVNSENHVTEIPIERWNNDAFYSENKDTNGKHYVKRAGLIKSHDEWDHRLFGVSESEASRIDPQQRYVLECTHMAMEDGGIRRADLKGSQTGVYIVSKPNRYLKMEKLSSVMNDDYKSLASSDHNDDTNYSATGMSTTLIASRVSYTYDLKGPCMVIDTACSSSMVAIHLGSQAIRSGDCEIAICGGVSSIISPDTFITLCKARMMSAVGQCQTFCDTADGYARSEGCGVVILKTVKKALEDDDNIWAVIYTGCNQDGHASSPITAPSGYEQEMLLHKVYRQNHVDPTSLQYIEVHGTGTPLGDPTETNALGRFINAYRTERHTIGDTNLWKGPDPYRAKTVYTYNIENSTEYLADNHNRHLKIKPESSEEHFETSKGVKNDTEIINGDHEQTINEPDNAIEVSVKKIKNTLILSEKRPDGIGKSAELVTDRDHKRNKVIADPGNNKFIKIGSVKTNIGHTESAAGVAGLIKALLMMTNGKIVPSLHLKKDKSNLNKNIKLDDYCLDIAHDVETWKQNLDGDRICCVNSFGFGGSNSHAILIQRSCLHKPKSRQPYYETISPYYLFCLSAMDKIALKNTIQLFMKNLEHTEESMQDIAYTCAFRRDHYANRTMLYGKTKEQLKEQIKSKLRNINIIKLPVKTRIIFVFCGVGTTWKGMCSELMSTQPVFRAKIVEIDSYLKPLTGWCIADKFKTSTYYSDAFLNHIAIFCAQVALVALWEYFGISPDVIIGQSIGEVAASVASRSISLQDGVLVVYYRSKVLAEMTGGKMMVVGNMSLAKIQELCNKYDQRVTIAVYNSPTSCTLSGDEHVIGLIKHELEKLNAVEHAGILIRLLSVQCAYHSHHVQLCMQDIELHLKFIKKEKRTVEHISCVTGELATEDEFQTGKYWAENIRKPVKFMHSILKASKENVTNVFIEIGPRQVLRAHLRNIIGKTLSGKCLGSMNTNKENTCIYASLSELYEMGMKLNLRNFMPSHCSAVSIPQYGFNKSKILYIPETAYQALKGTSVVANKHIYVRQNGNEQVEFRIEIDQGTTSFVYDHIFLKSTVVPGSTYVEAAFEIGQIKTEYTVNEMSVSVEFVKFCTPPDDKRLVLEIEVTGKDTNGCKFRVFQDNKTLCNGTICRRSEQQERSQIDIERIKERCTACKTKEECYSNLEHIGFEYGDSLRLIQKSWSSTTECIVELTVPESIKLQTKHTHMHPSIIDAMFQTFGLFSTDESDSATVPKGAGSVVINRFPKERMVCYSRMVNSTKVGKQYNCLLLSTEGYAIAEIQDFYTRTLHISEAPNEAIVYDVAWNEQRIYDIESGNSDNDNGIYASGQILVFGTQRFNNYFLPIKNMSNAVLYDLNDSVANTESMFKQVFDRKPNARVVVFAAYFDIRQLKSTTQTLYDYSKNNFLSLAILIKVLKDRDYNVPVFVITENVMAYPALNITSSNICGSELWGMVRSAMVETAYNDIRMVDMSLTEENANAIEYLMRPNTPNQNEYLIHRGRIFVSEIIEAPQQHNEPHQRQMDIDETDEFLLKSTHQTQLMKPHFQLRQSNNAPHNATVSPFEIIQIKSISLHNKAIYPTSTEFIDQHSTIWTETAGKSFDVIALEGIGWIGKNNEAMGFRNDFENSLLVGFCHPISVSSKVCIPSKCLFDAESLPVYIPGLMTLGIILWNIAKSCKQSSTIYVVADDEFSPKCLLLSSILAKKKKRRIIVGTKDKMNDLKTRTILKTLTIIVLTHISQTHVNILLSACPNLQKVVSIDEYLPRALQRLISLSADAAKLQILNTEKMFTQTELSKKIPKVHRWLNSLDTIFCQKLSTSSFNYGNEANCDTDPFKLPCQTFALHKTDCSYIPIPLKVFKDQVFRKQCCYIIVGGLTGLGWELLQVMAELGAGSLATFSRRPPTVDKQEEIEGVQREFGCKIVCVKVDITDLEQLKNAMEHLQSFIGGKRIKGVFHGGGVVNDVILSKMTDDDASKALQPKILGTLNLHLVTKGMSLDFFVMHSSIVSILGNPGQCNYAAGNSFQDSFAHYRRSIGLCGQSINWSALSVGMATNNKDLEQIFRRQGFFFLSSEDIRSCFIRAVMTNPPQVVFGIFDWRRLGIHPTVQMYPHKFVRLLEKYGTKPQRFRSVDSTFHIDTEQLSKNYEIVIKLVTKIVSDIFMMEMESLKTDTQIASLGIDSMTAMSLTNTIFEKTQVRVQMFTILSDTTTIASLSTYIFENVHNDSSENKPKPEVESTNLLTFFNGNVTFMQTNFLKDFVKDPLSHNFLRQADFEVTGLQFKPKDWKVILNYLLKINPELRKIYIINKEENTFDSRLLSPDEVEVDLESVPFDSICNESATDERSQNCFDLTKELPIRFKIACFKNKTRMRMFLHSVISDLSGISMLFRDIGSIIKAYFLNKPLPEKETDINPAECVRQALVPPIADLKKYWKQQLSQDIQPFTFSNDLEKDLKESNWFQVKRFLPNDLVKSVLGYTQKKGISLYNYVTSIYMVFLHEKTGKDIIPIVTNIDMRNYVPQLKDFVTRCNNVVPVIGDMRSMGTVNEYMKKSSDRLQHMTQQSGYPFELIQEEMETDFLRRYIGRHRLIMDNMTQLNQTLKHKLVTVKFMNVFHTRHVYETTLLVWYDLKENTIALEYGYNADAVKHELAMSVPMQLMELMKTCLEYPSATVLDVLASKVAVSKVYSISNYHNDDNRIAIKRLGMNESVDNVRNVPTDKRTTIRLPSDHRSGQLCTFGNVVNNTKLNEEHLIVLKKDYFQKQTTQGWDHDVFVVMAKDTSQAEEHILLQWGKTSKSRHKCISLNAVTAVYVMKLQGAYGLLLQIPNTWIVLKTRSQVQAAEWEASLKSEIRRKSEQHDTTDVRL